MNENLLIIRDCIKIGDGFTNLRQIVLHDFDCFVCLFNSVDIISIAFAVIRMDNNIVKVVFQPLHKLLLFIHRFQNGNNDFQVIRNVFGLIVFTLHQFGVETVEIILIDEMKQVIK